MANDILDKNGLVGANIPVGVWHYVLGEENIYSDYVALLFAFIFIISYSMCMHFLVLENKPSQFNNLTFVFYKLTIMTEINVHFLS